MSDKTILFTCYECKQFIRYVQKGGFACTGYATVMDGDEEKKICYKCCGKRDEKTMKETGAMDLYLVTKGKRLVVSNWPGTLEFPVRGIRNGKHFIPNCGYTTS